MNDLTKYVIENCIRGECTCGRCTNKSAKKFQPDGHTADVQFFKIMLKNPMLNDSDKEVMKNNFIQLINNHQGVYKDIDIFDGKEYNFVDIGGWIGDQGTALALMGMGELLGLWKVETPNRIAHEFSEETRNMLAMTGYISIKYYNDEDKDGDKNEDKKE